MMLTARMPPSDELGFERYLRDSYASLLARLRGRFEDGTSGEVDLSYLRDYGGVFEPLRDPDYFRRLRVDPEAGTIVWPNGADIAPETLYAHARGRTAATA